MQSKCEVCGKPVISALHENIPPASRYWRLNEFPDYSKGVVYFCSAEHATAYNKQLTKP